ncbi:MAG: hypothetical protein FWG64_05035, partial [Firmicutes bacterium]|nr:hypothetical protein [Bacillota bacterium]
MFSLFENKRQLKPAIFKASRIRSLLSLFIAFALLIGLVPAQVFAAEDDAPVPAAIAGLDARSGITVSAGQTLELTQPHIGGIEVPSGGTLIMQPGSRIDGSVLVSGGTFIMNDGVIVHQEGVAIGAGVTVSSGSFEMHGGRITGFDTGVRVYESGSFDMYDGLIDNNHSLTDGGGVSAIGSGFVMHGGTIAQNYAPRGGGIFVQLTNPNNPFVMNGGVVAQNTATSSAPATDAYGPANRTANAGGVMVVQAAGGMNTVTVPFYNDLGDGREIFIQNRVREVPTFVWNGGTIQGNTVTNRGTIATDRSTITVTQRIIFESRDSVNWQHTTPNRFVVGGELPPNGVTSMNSLNMGTVDKGYTATVPSNWLENLGYGTNMMQSNIAQSPNDQGNRLRTDNVHVTGTMLVGRTTNSGDTVPPIDVPEPPGPPPVIPEPGENVTVIVTWHPHEAANPNITVGELYGSGIGEVVRDYWDFSHGDAESFFRTVQQPDGTESNMGIFTFNRDLNFGDRLFDSAFTGDGTYFMISPLRDRENFSFVGATQNGFFYDWQGDTGFYPFFTTSGQNLGIGSGPVNALHLTPFMESDLSASVFRGIEMVDGVSAGNFIHIHYEFGADPEPVEPAQRNIEVTWSHPIGAEPDVTLQYDSQTNNVLRTSNMDNLGLSNGFFRAQEVDVLDGVSSLAVNPHITEDFNFVQATLNGVPILVEDAINYRAIIPGLGDMHFPVDNTLRLHFELELAGDLQPPGIDLPTVEFSDIPGDVIVTWSPAETFEGADGPTVPASLSALFGTNALTLTDEGRLEYRVENLADVAGVDLAVDFDLADGVTYNAHLLSINDLGEATKVATFTDLSALIAAINSQDFVQILGTNDDGDLAVVRGEIHLHIEFILDAEVAPPGGITLPELLGTINVTWNPPMALDPTVVFGGEEVSGFSLTDINLRDLNPTLLTVDGAHVGYDFVGASVNGAIPTRLTLSDNPLSAVMENVTAQDFDFTNRELNLHFEFVPTFLTLPPTDVTPPAAVPGTVIVEWTPFMAADPAITFDGTTVSDIESTEIGAQVTFPVEDIWSLVNSNLAVELGHDTNFGLVSLTLNGENVDENSALAVADNLDSLLAGITGDSFVEVDGENVIIVRYEFEVGFGLQPPTGVTPPDAIPGTVIVEWTPFMAAAPAITFDGTTV